MAKFTRAHLLLTLQLQIGNLNYVSESEGKGKEDYEIGLLGRNQKEQDNKELKIVYEKSQSI